ncbi:hypothetical protein BCD64_02395 [Nostoc sp. MBR 210]|nr:hypothetical protein BCD64_02395 [Nostoc sp. MBR 210]
MSDGFAVGDRSTQFFSYATKVCRVALKPAFLKSFRRLMGQRGRGAEGQGREYLHSPLLPCSPAQALKGVVRNPGQTLTLRIFAPLRETKIISSAIPNIKTQMHIVTCVYLYISALSEIQHLA